MPTSADHARVYALQGVVKHMDGSGTWVFQRTDSGYTDYRVWYDDEESLGPKYQMVREAGWGGECYPD